jgi:uncharacterized protein DUF2809
MNAIQTGYRLRYAGLALATIAVGLCVHRTDGMLTSAVRDKLGDALWAAMIVWWISAFVPSAALRVRIIAALTVCFVVEGTQLYHTEVLDSARRTMAGHLVLGSGFDVLDLLAYTLGVLVAGLLEYTGVTPGRLKTPDQRPR